MDSAAQDDDFNFPKYFRPGYISEGDEKNSHTFADFAFSFFPDAEKMPKYWHYRSYEHFQKKHGHLGEVVWCRTKSYHMLIVKGQRIFRIWTDTSIARVDLCSTLSAHMQNKGYDVGYISRDPFNHRMLAEKREDIQTLMGVIKEVYGL